MADFLFRLGQSGSGSVTSYFVSDTVLTQTGHSITYPAYNGSYPSPYSFYTLGALFIGTASNYFIVSTIDTLYWYSINTNGSFNLINTISATSGTTFTNAITSYTIGGTLTICVGIYNPTYANGMLLYSVDSSGKLSQSRILTNSTIGFSVEFCQVTINSITYIYVANSSGYINIIKINDDGILNYIGSTSETYKATGITGLTNTYGTYLYVINESPSQGGNGHVAYNGNITVLQVSSNGSLTPITTYYDNMYWPNGIDSIASVNSLVPNQEVSLLLVANYATGNFEFFRLYNSESTQMTTNMVYTISTGGNPGFVSVTHLQQASTGSIVVYALNIASNNNGGIYAFQINENYTIEAANYFIDVIGLAPGGGYGKLVAGTVTAPEEITNPVPVPISNICFPAGTPIQTNQGEIAIEKIDPKVHTIRNKKIVDITKTISPEKYLVCIEKDALGNNIPSQETKISKNHCIYYNGKMIKAKDLLGDKVRKVKYNGEVLYNVLMENHEKMLVNNLICETLDPLNSISKLYKLLDNVSDSDKYEYIKQLNNYVEVNDVFGKKKVVK